MAAAHDPPSAGGRGEERDLDFLSLHPFVRSTAHDKVLGTIIGSALGDCIGLYTEFLPQTLAESSYPNGKFWLVEPITPLRKDTHRDDTDHALLIILSYLHNKGTLIPTDFAARLRVWCTQGLRCLDRLPLGLGRTVGSVVLSPDYPTSPTQTALQHWHKSSRSSAANGSLMRTHPLGLMCIPYSPEYTLTVAAEFSALTHVDPRCVLSCCVVTALVRGIVRGEIVDEEGVDGMLETVWKWASERDELVDPRLENENRSVTVDANMNADKNKNDNKDQPANKPESEREKNTLSHEEYINHVSAPSLAALQLDAATKIGYVYKCLGAAIFSLRVAMRSRKSTDPSQRSSISNIFESIITTLTIAGGDADTNATVAGALVGAYLGHTALPPHWTGGMMNYTWLLEKSVALSRVIGIDKTSTSQRDPHGDEDAGAGASAEGDPDPDTGPDGNRGFLTQKELDERERGLYEKILLKQAARRDREREKKKGGGMDGVRKLVRGLGLGS